VWITLVTVYGQNLVGNGGFEQGLAVWGGAYSAGPADYAFEGTSIGTVYDRGSSSVDKTMYQVLSTEPLVPYRLRFSLLAPVGRVGEVGPPSPVQIRWDGTNVAQVTSTSATVWQTFEYALVAKSSVTELNFESLGRNPTFIDAISVTVIPEPSCVALLLAAALFVLVAGRCRGPT
jgi:hypothetical protein